MNYRMLFALLFVLCGYEAVSAQTPVKVQGGIMGGFEFLSPSDIATQSKSAKIAAAGAEDVDLGSTSTPQKATTKPTEEKPATAAKSSTTEAKPRGTGFYFVAVKNLYDGLTLGGVFANEYVLQSEIDVGYRFGDWTVTGMTWVSTGFQGKFFKDFNTFARELDLGVSAATEFHGVALTASAWVYYVAKSADTQIIDLALRASKPFQVAESSQLQLFAQIDSFHLTDSTVFGRAGKIPAVGVGFTQTLSKRFEASVQGKYAYDLDGAFGFLKGGHILTFQANAPVKIGAWKVGPILACFGSPNDPKKPAHCGFGVKAATSFSF